MLRGGFLQPDSYSEIEAQYFLPGGETGTAATVLSSLGASVRMAGTHIGTEVAPLLKDFYRDKPVDLSPLYFDPDDPGVMDYVVIAGLVRSPMGRFQTLFSQDSKWWNTPQEQDIKGCRAASIDPFFREESILAAVLCVKHGVPYVTIDALLHNMGDDELVRFASACSGVAISRFPLPLHPPTLEEVAHLINQA